MNHFDPGYQEWLKSLTEGEEVAYDNSLPYHRSKNWKIQRIAKITPTRQFRLGNNDLFNNKGKLVGGEYSIYIQPVTDEIRETVERERVLSRIRHTQWDKLPTDVLQHIEAWILFEEGAKTVAGHNQTAEEVDVRTQSATEGRS
ncbi:hypothetical protein D3C76_1087550 [compost metagenome]